MNSSRQLIGTLMSAGFDIGFDTIFVTLAQPFWVNADSTEMALTFYEDTVWVQLRFNHHKTLLKFGDDVETVKSMKDLCASEWFPELEQRFSRVVEYFNLSWQKEGDVDNDFVPIMCYSLLGELPQVQTDRMAALLLEIRSVLDG